ncbi:MAG: carbamoyltransferase HypF [Chitinophagales bacterium]
MTFHLHISGRVQGVGFRPHVYKCATEKNISGCVSNEADGVHVFFNCTFQKQADDFVKLIMAGAPSRSIIQHWHLTETTPQPFSQFSIQMKENNASPDLLISPDFAMCPQCRDEFHDTKNRRYQYPFITCTLCGPRYSIMRQLPYERHLTTMQKFTQCPECRSEYDDVNDRRYFSQTNSCATCGIQLSWHSNNNGEVLSDPKQILPKLLQAFTEGKIVAIKGVGGFLLMCDAVNEKAIQTLRERKHRPQKPFAVLFSDVEKLRQYVPAKDVAINALLSEASPIVLMQANQKCFDELDMNGIAPGLSSIGVMIPYAPLLEWISSSWKNPLIATSGNLSGSCIVFQSEKKEQLFQVADFILDHNRDIVIPQDDSVIRFAEESNQKIFIRRSRGFAPATIIETEFKSSETIFAAGVMLKSAFAILHNNQIHLSQYLGDLESYDAQQNYLHTLNHFEQLLNAKPKNVLADLHPDYPSTKIAEKFSAQLKVPLKKIQHHEAHFAAILGEHNLFDSNEKILGVIWDGTGLGSDGNIWGGEFFIYQNGSMQRIHYLEPFTNLAGDKMAKEPRIAALAISNGITGALSILKSKFSDSEWAYYQKAMAQPGLQNSSGGRYFDGVAGLLNLVNSNSYEGEGGLLLEQQAYKYLLENNFKTPAHYFEEGLSGPVIPMKHLISRVITDIDSGKSTAEIAAKFHLSLAAIIHKVGKKSGVRNIAFSGGVFQNALLIDSIILRMGKKFQLYFHKQMPPNDECIAFGQLMHNQSIKNLDDVEENYLRASSN